MSKMKYPDMTWGTMEAVINKLGGIEGVQRFLSGETVVKAVERVFQVWKTIKLGTGLKTAKDFRRALTDGGYRIGNWGDDILGKPAFTANETETEADLVVVSVEELGFKDGATRADIYNRAKELGLELCPSEVGPQLRLQYKDQPKGEWLLIAMEPIAVSDGRLTVFDVEHVGDGLWLDCHGRPDRFWGADYRWVFLRRK
jgi:hypothetical protein